MAPSSAPSSEGSCRNTSRAKARARRRDSPPAASSAATCLWSGGPGSEIWIISSGGCSPYGAVGGVGSSGVGATCAVVRSTAASTGREASAVAPAGVAAGAAGAATEAGPARSKARFARSCCHPMKWSMRLANEGISPRATGRSAGRAALDGRPTAAAAEGAGGRNSEWWAAAAAIGAWHTAGIGTGCSWTDAVCAVMHGLQMSNSHPLPTQVNRLSIAPSSRPQLPSHVNVMP